MKTSEQTFQQLSRMINKIAEKFPATENPSLLTDIHLRVSQDSGDLFAYDDNDQEITRCVVEQWIDCQDEDFYDSAAAALRSQLKRMHDVVDGMGLMKPFSFVLEDDDRQTVAELYVADDDTVIIGGDLMQGVDEELDKFFDDLMKE